MPVKITLYIYDIIIILLCSRAVASIRWVELQASCSCTGTWDRPQSRDPRTGHLVHDTNGAPRDSWAAALASPQSNNPCNNQIVVHCIIVLYQTCESGRSDLRNYYRAIQWCNINSCGALRIFHKKCCSYCLGTFDPKAWLWQLGYYIR